MTVGGGRDLINVNKTIKMEDISQYVAIWFYLNDEIFDSTIMEYLNDDGSFSDFFQNQHYEGSTYGFQYSIGDILNFRDHRYIIADVKFAYIPNQPDNGAPFIIQVYLRV